METIPTETLNQYISYYQRYQRRGEEFVRSITTCEICCDNKKEFAYSCNTHKICGKCFHKIDSCPFCQRPRKNCQTDLWVRIGDKQWEQLSDFRLERGLDPDFDYENYIDRATRAFVHSFSVLSDPRLKHIPSDFSIDNLFHMLADNINQKLNFPIFVWRDHKHLRFDGDRFDKILDSITAVLNIKDYEALRLRQTLRYGMAQTLNKIRSLKKLPKVRKTRGKSQLFAELDGILEI
jgi:hypothetical protein